MRAMARRSGFEMKQKNITFASLFVVLEVLIMLVVWSNLKGELWYYKILLIMLYTLFAFELSFALMNILFVQYICSLKKEISTLFLFEKEKLKLKWLINDIILQTNNKVFMYYQV